MPQAEISPWLRNRIAQYSAQHHYLQNSPDGPIYLRKLKKLPPQVADSGVHVPNDKALVGINRSPHCSLNTFQSNFLSDILGHRNTCETRVYFNFRFLVDFYSAEFWHAFTFY